MVERLSAEDAGILALERGNVRGHTCKLLLVEGDHPAPDVRRLLDDRIVSVPRLRRRLVAAPLGPRPAGAGRRRALPDRAARPRRRPRGRRRSATRRAGAADGRAARSRPPALGVGRPFPGGAADRPRLAAPPRDRRRDRRDALGAGAVLRRPGGARRRVRARERARHGRCAPLARRVAGVGSRRRRPRDRLAGQLGARGPRRGAAAGGLPPRARPHRHAVVARPAGRPSPRDGLRRGAARAGQGDRPRRPGAGDRERRGPRGGGRRAAPLARRGGREARRRCGSRCR